MSGRERNAQAGPSAPRQPPQNPTSSSWTMSLFGGRQSKSTSSNLGWGRPTTSSTRNREERESLIGQSSGDDFDDSDAISLLSNIADRDSSRGGSAAARRRARARSRAQGRTCGTFWFDVEDWSRSLSCGLLGRGQRGDGGAGGGRQRAASIGSVMSRGARRNNAPSSEEQVVATSRHSRSHSDASTDSAGSLAGSGFAEIDADAGMLDDRDIARFGTQPSPTEESESDLETEAARAKAAEEEAKARAEAEAAGAEALAAAERQKALEAETSRLQAEAEAESMRQKEEEARLAAEEEAAIAKARRKAQRKAAKAGLLQLQQETQAAHRWRTEAEAEAAAGGFAFADAEGDVSYEGGAQQQQQQFQYHDAEYGLEEEHEQYGDAEEASGYYAGTVQEQGPGGVVHHHHYYHSAPPVVEEEEEFHYPVPEPQVHEGAFSEDCPEPATAEKVSEDEADIAGLSFGRKKTRRNQSGSTGSRSGSGLRPAHTTGGSSSGGSASALPPPISASSSSSSSRAPYRDRPRRHERTTSKSSNSSSGIFSYHSSNTIHPGPASTAATSVTSPGAAPLPNLYESQSVYPAERGGGETLEVEHAQFGKPEVDASEFGVITAGSHRGGAGRVKKSYKDKRLHQAASNAEEGEGKFEGFPGF